MILADSIRLLLIKWGLLRKPNLFLGEPPCSTGARALFDPDTNLCVAYVKDGQFRNFSSDAAYGITGVITLAQVLAAGANAGGLIISNHGTPSSSTDVPNKAYVDAALLALRNRYAVRVASTVSLSGSGIYNGLVIDGVTIATGDLVLNKDSGDPEDNGIWVAAATAGFGTRSPEFNTYDSLCGLLVAVQEGTANADSLWLGISNEGGTLGATAVAFSRVGPGLTRIVSNPQSADYVTVDADAGRSIDHPSSDANAREWAIAEGYETGTFIGFTNMSSVALRLSTITDSLYLQTYGTVGPVYLAPFSEARARRVASGQWLISGDGLTGFFYRDTLTDANAVGLPDHEGEVGATYTLELGSGIPVIDGNRVRGAAGGFSLHSASGVPASADYYVEARIKYFTAVATNAGVAARIDGDDFYFAVHDSANQRFELWRAVAGSGALMGSVFNTHKYFNVTLSAGQEFNIALECRGGTVRLFYNGALALAHLDATPLAVAGFPGIWLNCDCASATGYHVGEITAQNGRYGTFARDYAFSIDGDSLPTDYGRLGTPTPLHYLSAGWNTAGAWNLAVAGQRANEASADAAAQVDPLFAEMAGYTRKIYIAVAGINDAAQGASGATIYSRIQALVAGRVSAGFETVVCTMPPAASVTGGEETARVAANVLLRADHSFSTFFLDLDADSRFSNPTYLQGDLVHWLATLASVFADLVIDEVG